MRGETLYDILNVSSNASSNEIKKAYRKLSYQYHPDKHPHDPEKEEKFKMINQAYQTLFDEQSRNQYDIENNIMHGQNSIPQFNANMNVDGFRNSPAQKNAFSIFDNLFNGSFSHSVNNIPSSTYSDPNHHSSINQRSMNQKGIEEFLNLFENTINSFPTHNTHSNKNVTITECDQNTTTIKDIDVYEEILFEDSFNGTCIPIQVSRTIILDSFEQIEKEKIYLTIPKGVDHDEIITIKQKGNQYNKIHSNVKVHIKVKNHHLYRREGLNIIYEKHVTFKESLCGFHFVLPYITGKELKFSSSEGNIVQNYDKKIISNMGFERNDKRGNLIIVFRVDIPDIRLNESQLKLIRDIF